METQRKIPAAATGEKLMNEKKTKGGKELLLYLLFTAALMLLFTGCGENYIEKGYERKQRS